MHIQSITATIILALGASTAFSQAAPDYQVPLTEHGHPDLQGVWWTEFSTLMNRPEEGVTSLAVSPEAADQVATAIQSFFTDGNVDPQFLWEGRLPLAQVDGEYRSSLIIYPEDGQIPFSEVGRATSTELMQQGLVGFDGPEQRPLSERCLSGTLSAPPMFTLPIRLPRLFVQTEDYLAIYTEDSSGLRIVDFDGGAASPATSQFEGYSVGRWEGDTLLVTTSNFRHDFPGRGGVPFPMVVGENTVIEEQFTRVSDDRLLYRFTVSDPVLYTDDWRGEYEMNLGDSNYSYVYECHEGNYSLPGALRGGRVQELDAELADD